MKPDFFKTDINEGEFRQHARNNYKVGEPIDPEGIRHPVWVHEAATMNLEVFKALQGMAVAQEIQTDAEIRAQEIEDQELADLLQQEKEDE